MKQKNAALVLVSQGNVRGVIQVRKEALEKNPELLEQLRRDAHELYNQSLIIEEHCEELDVGKVSQWLRDMNPPAEDEELKPWEEAARWAISGMIENLDWRPAAGSVVVMKDHDGPEGPECVECTGLDDLIHQIEEAGQAAWDERVPVDGGGQVFEMKGEIDIKEELFERCEMQLEDLGWT